MKRMHSCGEMLLGLLEEEVLSFQLLKRCSFEVVGFVSSIL